ncbi:MAG TPA: M48 family metalloprotease [Isosphaeraceae bacterium]|jgi:Zn-dependent protease with chaperone function|nr:M48 family metalloprotease [Isosphaeraceae bacterium]
MPTTPSALFPATWPGWLPLAIPPAAFALSWSCARLGSAIALGPFRRSQGESWTERARLAHVARMANGKATILLPPAFGLLAYDATRVVGTRGWLPARLAMVLAAAAALLGVILVAERTRRVILGAAALRPGREGRLIWLILGPQLLIFGLLFLMIPAAWGPRAVASLAVGAAVLAFSMGGGWLALARRVGLARPASPRLAAIVARAAERVGVRPRGVDELKAPEANALAMLFCGRLVFTDGILTALDDDGLTAVAAHELGHLAEPRRVKVARAAGASALLLPAAAWPVGHTFGWGAFLGLMLAFVIAIVALNRVARRMEERSDAVGRAHEGDAGTYARALEEIHRANLIPAVLLGKGRRQVHPFLYDRMLAAGVEPAYPRPGPPSKGRLRLATLPALGLFTLAVSAGTFGVALSPPGIPSRAPARRVDPGRIARARTLADDARRSLADGDAEEAAEDYEAAGQLDPTEPRYPADLAVVLAGLGRCDEARIAAQDAARRLARGEAVRPDAAGRQAVEAALRAVAHCPGESEETSLLDESPLPPRPTRGRVGIARQRASGSP